MAETLSNPETGDVGQSTFRRLKEENSRLLHEEISRRATVYRAMPEVVTLNHTDICNLECIMCPRNRKKGRHRLPRPVLEHVTAELFPTARKAVLTTAGGEPLAVDFDFLLEKAIQYEVVLDVVTNGILLTPELYAHARKNLDHINISCESHIPEVYEHIRRGASYARLKHNLMGIHEIRLRSSDTVILSLSAVVLGSNLPHLDEFVRFAKEMGVDGVVFQRAQAYMNPTPEELPEKKYTPDQILEFLENARTAAREVEMNLFLSEFHLPPVMETPLRAKTPVPIEDQGLCWFLGQNFGIMYTGDVYPCCIANDHCLGNVLFQDVMDIWNSENASRLRAAHLSGRGCLFCSGCIHAPHLKSPHHAWVRKPFGRTRMIARHLKRVLKRRFAPSMAHTILEPPIPQYELRDGGFLHHEGACEITPFPYPNEGIQQNPWDKSLWFVREGSVFRMAGLDKKADLIIENTRDRPPKLSCLYFLDARNALVGFQEDGKLLRITLGAEGATLREVLTLSDPRSFIRNAVATDASDTVWIGEYGIFPGARCANLYRSLDNGDTFQKVRRFNEAKHIHAVYVSRSNGRVMVTTGDLAGERRLYIGSGKGRAFKALQRAWSGFTAIAETAHYFHFGTDLMEGNGFVRYTADFGSDPEFRPLPEKLDLQLRHITALGQGRLLALGTLDRNIAHLGHERCTSLFLSEDEGSTWTVIQPFNKDWSNAPEYLELIEQDPLTFVSVSPTQPVVLKLSF